MFEAMKINLRTLISRSNIATQVRQTAIWSTYGAKSEGRKVRASAQQM